MRTATTIDAWRAWRWLPLVLGLAVAACVTAPAPASHLILIDPHVDLPPPIAPRPATGTRDQGTQIDFEKVRAGGLSAIFPSVFVEQGPLTEDGYRQARAEADDDLASIRAIAETHPDAVLALSADDIVRAAAQGKTAILIGMLNAYPLGRDPEALRDFYARGVRQFGLVHAGNNDFADSSRPRSGDGSNGGLSPLGLRAIAIANELGILVDVSQLSTPAFFQALHVSTAPVIASHSGVRALVDSPRNLSDAELDALAANGGVVAIVAFSSYLRQTTPAEAEAVRALRERYGATNGYGALSYEQREQLGREQAALVPRATLDQYVDSIDYAVRRIGIDHVAISSDFNHGGGINGWADEGEAGNVTQALRRRGYGDAEVAKLWGGNVLRVLREAERRARR